MSKRTIVFTDETFLISMSVNNPTADMVYYVIVEPWPPRRQTPKHDYDLACVAEFSIMCLKTLVNLVPGHQEGGDNSLVRQVIGSD
jgi:hypothetical protein